MNRLGIAYFQQSGKLPELMQTLKIIEIATSAARNFSLVTETWDNDASVLGIKFSKTLPLSLIVHWFAKYSLSISVSACN